MKAVRYQVSFSYSLRESEPDFLDKWEVEGTTLAEALGKFRQAFDEKFPDAAEMLILGYSWEDAA